MRKSPVIPVLILLIFIQCARTRIIRTTLPVERADTEVIQGKTALIRTYHCDIYLRHIDAALWKTIRKQDCFMSESEKYIRIRDPRFTGFLAVIKNTSRYPVNITDPHIVSNGMMNQSLTVSETEAICSSQAYSRYDFPAILSTRTVTGGPLRPGDIEFDKETIPAESGAIAPDKTASVIYLFRWLPVKHRTIKVTLTVNSPHEKKVIDFDFMRKEYRFKGKYFLKPDARGI